MGTFPGAKHLHLAIHGFVVWPGGVPAAQGALAHVCSVSARPLSPLCLLQRLVAVLKMAAASVKKESKLPAVALDLLRLALQENKFPRFWKEVVEQGLLKKQFWPARCVRCSSAPRSLFSVKQRWTWGPEVHPGTLGL